VEGHLGGSLPLDYKDVLRKSDGLDGFIGNTYISLWSVADLQTLNERYSVSEFAPGVTLIGSDGSNTGYGFTADSAGHEYVEVPLVGMSTQDVSHLGNSFDEFLNNVARRQSAS
jgi:hypothetical protein